jgi:hypothetical protein
MASQEKHLLRVIKGGFVPADNYTATRLREKGYHVGDMVNAVLTKARNPAFNRLVHAFGNLVSENIPMFEGMDAHKVLKRVQVEARIECDEVLLYAEGIGEFIQFIPRSLSFSSMDETRFKEVFKLMCRHIAKTYWHGLSAEKIEEMAELMVDE